jgi:hypothetical protein
MLYRMSYIPMGIGQRCACADADRCCYQNPIPRGPDGSRTRSLRYAEAALYQNWSYKPGCRGVTPAARSVVLVYGFPVGQSAVVVGYRTAP